MRKETGVANIAKVIDVAVVALAEVLDFVHAETDLVLHFFVEIVVEVLYGYGFAERVLEVKEGAEWHKRTAHRDSEDVGAHIVNALSFPHGIVEDNARRGRWRGSRRGNGFGLFWRRCFVEQDEL